MSYNHKQTSEEIATLASAVLRDPLSKELGKKLAGSALSQSSTDKQTGAEMEELASKILSDRTHSATERSLAASVLAQANKER